MVKYAACYPGQGAQKKGMAIDLYEKSQKVRALFELASDVTKIDVYNLLANSEEQLLQQTEHAQLAITVANRSVATVLAENGIVFSSHAGSSLGEYSAYAGSGVLKEADLFQIVQKRGILMAKAIENSVKTNGELTMAAVVGIGFDKVSEVLTAVGAEGLYCSNDNAPTQVVIAGTASEIAKHTESLKAAGAKRVITLRVSGPFHTPYMATIESEFRDYLENFTFFDPISPLYLNVTGEMAKDGKEVRSCCIEQLSTTVRWTKIMQTMVSQQQITHALEVGPGTALSGLWRSSNTNVDCFSCGTYDELQRFLEERK